MGRKAETRISGEKLRALMLAYGLKGNKGAEIAGNLIHVQRHSIQQYLSHGISRTLYELLECRLEHK